jgi:hypothetical protein
VDRYSSEYHQVRLTRWERSWSSRPAASWIRSRSSRRRPRASPANPVIHAALIRRLNKQGVTRIVHATTSVPGSEIEMAAQIRNRRTVMMVSYAPSSLLARVFSPPEFKLVRIDETTWEPGKLAIAWARSPVTSHPALDQVVEQLAVRFNATMTTTLRCRKPPASFRPRATGAARTLSRRVDLAGAAHLLLTSGWCMSRSAGGGARGDFLSHRWSLPAALLSPLAQTVVVWLLSGRLKAGGVL